MSISQHPNLLHPHKRRRFHFHRVRVSAVILLGFLAAPLCVGILFTGAFRSSARKATIRDTLPPQTNQAEEIREPSLSHVSTVPVTGVSQGAQQDTIRWFRESDGTAYEKNLRTGKIQTISSDPISDFVTGLWIPGKLQAIILSDSATFGKQYRFIDYQDGTRTQLERNISVLAISPDGMQVVYVVPGPGTSSLIKKSSITGSDTKTVFQTRLGVAKIFWPEEDKIIFSAWKSSSEKTDLLSLAQNNTLTTLFSGKENLELTISEHGNILTSYYDASVGLVVIRDPVTAEVVYLSKQVSAEKCGWIPGSGEEVFCGVAPENTSAHGSSLYASHDSFLVLNTKTGDARVLQNKKDVPVSVYNPVVTRSGDWVAFLDLFDHSLYSLKLDE